MNDNLIKAPTADETLDRLIAMTNQTCLVALDKTLYACAELQYKSYRIACDRCWNIAERITRCIHELGMTLPARQRAL